MIVAGGVIPPQDYEAVLQGRRRRDLSARHGHSGSGGAPDGAVAGEVEVYCGGSLIERSALARIRPQA